MARDRYSNNHTIQVVGEDKQVIIEDNLEVTDTLSVGDIDAGDDDNVNFHDDISVDLDKKIITSLIQQNSSGGIHLTIETNNSGNNIILNSSNDIILNTVPELENEDIRYVSIPSGAFSGLISNDTNSGIAGATYLSVSGTASNQFFYAALPNIPNGAIITGIRGTYKIQSALDDVTFRVIRYSQSDASSNTLGTATGSTADDTVHVTSETSISSNNVIDYEDYYYVLEIQIKDADAGAYEVRAYSVRITYTTLSVGL